MADLQLAKDYPKTEYLQGLPQVEPGEIPVLNDVTELLECLAAEQQGDPTTQELKALGDLLGYREKTSDPELFWAILGRFLQMRRRVNLAMDGQLCPALDLSKVDDQYPSIETGVKDPLAKGAALMLKIHPTNPELGEKTTFPQFSTHGAEGEGVRVKEESPKTGRIGKIWPHRRDADYAQEHKANPPTPALKRKPELPPQGKDAFRDLGMPPELAFREDHSGGFKRLR